MNTTTHLSHRALLKGILFVLLFTLTSTHVQAGWQRLNGPNGGMTRDVVELNGDLFAATEHGLYRSADGLAWSLVTGGLPEVYFNSVATNGTVLLAGAYGYGIYRSANGGTSWQLTSTVAVNDLQWHSGCFYAVADAGGIERSCNGGLTWQDADPNMTMGSYLQGLGSDGAYLFCIGSGSLMRTNDQGSTWTSAMNGLPAFCSPLRITGDAQRQLLTTAQHGVFLSTDHGGSWTSITVYNQPPSTWSGYSILQEGDTLHIGINYYGGVRRSTDGGATWSSVNTGLPTGISPHVLVRHGQDLLLGTNKGIWRGTGAVPQWAHTDGGVPHTSLTALAELNGKLFATARSTEIGESEGVHMSTDGGHTWQPRNAGLASELDYEALYAGQGILLANAQLNTYRSTDEGLTWMNLLAAGPDDEVTAFVEWNGGIYAATDGSGIFVSTDAGLTFTPIPSPNPIVGALHVHNGTLYAGTVSGLHSTTNGTTWTALNNGLSGVLDIRAITSGAGVMLVSAKSASYTQLYRSTNDGASWSLANTGMPYPMVCEALVAHNDTLYAGLDNSWPLSSSAIAGLYASTDGGLTWNDASADMPAGTSVRCFLALPNELLAGTHREGVWSRSNDLSTGHDAATAATTELTVWPVPTSDRANIRSTESGRVDVLDGTGRTVLTLRVNAYEDRALDMSTAPAGLYFVRHTNSSGTRTQRLVVTR